MGGPTLLCGCYLQACVPPHQPATILEPTMNHDESIMHQSLQTHSLTTLSYNRAMGWLPDPHSNTTE